jgi:hypothetical protein
LKRFENYRRSWKFKVATLRVERLFHHLKIVGFVSLLHVVLDKVLLWSHVALSIARPSFQKILRSNWSGVIVNLILLLQNKEFCRIVFLD